MPSLFSAVGDLMQKRPKVPKITDIDPGAEAAKATASNLKNLPEIEKLSTASNAYARKEQLRALDEFLGVGTRERITGNINAATRGELPDDVANMLERRAAERSTAGGYGGSGAGHNMGLRDLGLVSLQRSDYALDAASRWLATSREGLGTFNYTSMFVTPDMQIQQANIDRNAMFQRDWMSNQLDAAYAPSSIFGQNLKAFDAQMSRWMDATYGTMLSVAASQGGGQGQAVAGAAPGEGQFGAGGYGGSGAPGQYIGGGGGGGGMGKMGGGGSGMSMGEFDFMSGFSGV